MHISTDYVLDRDFAYIETDNPALNAYGISKLAGEHFVRCTTDKHFVVRSSAIYGKSPCRAKGGRSRSGTTRRSNHVLPTGGTARPPRPVGLPVPEGGQRDRVRPRLARRRRAAGRRPRRRRGSRRPRQGGPRPRPRQPQGNAVTAPQLPLPVRDDLRDLHPYGAPQLDVPVQLNTNENPYAPSQTLREAIAARSPAWPARSTATRTGTRPTCARTWPTTSATASPRRHLGRERLQRDHPAALAEAFGGPGRRAGLQPSYSTYPLHLRRSPAPRAAGRPRRRLRHVHGRGAAGKQHRPTSCSSPHRTTPPAPPSPWTSSGTCTTRRPAWSSWTRPTRSSPAQARRARSPCCRAGRASSSPARCPGVRPGRHRLGYLAADPAVIDALLLVRLPYHLSTVTQAVARAALAHKDEPLATVEALREGRDDLVAGSAARASRWPTATPTSCSSGFRGPRRDLAGAA